METFRNNGFWIYFCTQNTTQQKLLKSVEHNISLS
jgi:hypothetical protein